ncbi:unnamed protein product [Gongylonema pulchrum]|uniref:Peptidase_M14 domain-containing protein n=1 Tax=Gongylonema pulchrum TaxID=637853 RepID=A0A183D891_9BILA|nr:unnamed protein product [Gongylonema pulchrum]
MLCSSVYLWDVKGQRERKEKRLSMLKDRRYLAESYAKKHAHMAKNDHPPCDGTVNDAFAQHGGITNGAKWYSVSGGMQDFNYLATNAFEITLELSCDKFPDASMLPKLWLDNKEALTDFIRKVI